VASILTVSKSVNRQADRNPPAERRFENHDTVLTAKIPERPMNSPEPVADIFFQKNQCNGDATVDIWFNMPI
jgi:hypothetical protein